MRFGNLLLTYEGSGGNIITEGHYRKANGSPWLIVKKKATNLWRGGCFLSFHDFYGLGYETLS